MAALPVLVLVVLLAAAARRDTDRRHHAVEGRLERGLVEVALGRGERHLGLDQAGLGGGDVGLGGRGGQRLEVRLRLRDLRLRLGDRGRRAALAQLGEAGLGLDHRHLGLLQRIGAGVQQGVVLGLGVGQLLLGQRHLKRLLLPRAVVVHLGLLHRLLGAVQRRLSLHIGVVVLLALAVAELVLPGLAVGGGRLRVARVSAGVLHIVPVLLGGGVARLRLGQRVDRLLHAVVGAGLGLREAIARGLEAGRAWASWVCAAIRSAGVGFFRTSSRDCAASSEAWALWMSALVALPVRVCIQVRLGAIERRLCAGQILRRGAALRSPA